MAQFVFASLIYLFSADMEMQFDIASLDVESGIGIPLSSTEEWLDYTSGSLIQMNFKLKDDHRLNFSFSTGYGSYDSPHSNISGLYNFMALVGVGYNIALGDSPVSITPSVYGGVLGHILKSDIDSLDNIFDNLYANQIFGADFEAAITSGSLGFYLAGSYYIYANLDSYSMGTSAKAGLRYYFP